MQNSKGQMDNKSVSAYFLPLKGFTRGGGKLYKTIVHLSKIKKNTVFSPKTAIFLDKPKNLVCPQFVQILKITWFVQTWTNAGQTEKPDLSTKTALNTLKTGIL